MVARFRAAAVAACATIPKREPPHGALQFGYYLRNIVTARNQTRGPDLTLDIFP